MMVWIAIAREVRTDGSAHIVAIACGDTAKAARAKMVSDIEDNPELDPEFVLFGEPVEVEVVKEHKR